MGGLTYMFMYIKKTVRVSGSSRGLGPKSVQDFWIRDLKIKVRG